MADPHAEWSSWWAQSWYSGAPWFSAAHNGDDLPVTGRHLRVSPRSLTLAQSSTPSPSTFAASKLPHANNVGLNASTQTSVLISGRLHTDISEQPHSPSECIYSGGSTQCCFHRCLSTQLPLRELFLGCIYSNDPLDRAAPQPIHGNVSGASLPLLKDIDTTNSLSSTSYSSGPTSSPPVLRALLDCTPPSPPGLEGQALLGISHDIPSKAAPVRPHSHCDPSRTAQCVLAPPTSPHVPQPQVSTTNVGTHTTCSTVAHIRSACTALSGTHSTIGAGPRASRGPIPEA